MNFLTRISAEQLKNPLSDSAYFEVVKSISSDMDKANALQFMINQDSLSTANTFRIIALAGQLGSNMEKVNLYGNMIEKGLIRGNLFDTLLNYTSYTGSDMDRVNLYEKLVNVENELSEMQWGRLVNKAAELESDLDKTNLLIAIVQKMPATEYLKEIYRKAARKISDDLDYGRAMRALQ